MFRITLDTDAFLADLHRLKYDINAAAGAGLKAATNEAAEVTTEHNYKNRTGTLTTSRLTLCMPSGPMQWRSQITWHADYAKFVDEPTKAHAIVAKKAKMLRFYRNGQVVFRRSVWHPGTKGSGFSKAAEMHLSFDAPEEIQRQVDAAIARHP